jgi:hypothetical protein
MAAEHEPIEIGDKPELLRLVEEVEASGKPCVLQRNGQDVAVMLPIEADALELRSTSEDDPLWGIVGMFTSDGPSDVSSNKHKYLADAYGDLHENSPTE